MKNRINNTIHKLNVQNVLFYNAGENKYKFIQLLNSRSRSKRLLQPSSRNEVFEKVSRRYSNTLMSSVFNSLNSPI